MANRDYFNRVGWWRGVLYTSDHPHRRDEQGHYDQNRDHRPGQFHLIAAINLWWLTAVITFPLPEPYDRVDQQTENNHEYDRRYGKHEQGESKD
jgi:hypothetical protein